MKNKIKVGIVGILGKMGKAIFEELMFDNEMSLVAAAVKNLNIDADFFSNIVNTNFHVYESIEKVFEASDVVFEFTNPLTMEKCIDCAVQFQKPLVSGTTGHKHHALLDYASTKVPIFWAPNMSLGIYIVSNLIKSMAKNLLKDANIEILEIHHINKKDSPSGTALMLQNEIKNNIKKDATINSVRVNDEIGKHSIFFLFEGEKIELTHTATKRKSFAQGAINAAKWMYNKPNGLYSMIDLMK